MARPNRRTRSRLAAARRKARENSHRATGSRGHPRHAMELTLPIPPGMTPDELRAALALFADELRADGIELDDVCVCTSPDCAHGYAAR